MNPQGIIAALEGMKIRNDRTKLLETSKVPILMIISKKGPALDYNSLLQQAKKGAVQKVIFEDGHMSHVENQVQLIKELAKFLNLVLSI